MKKLLLIIILLISTQIEAQNYTFLGSYTSDGTPNYLEAKSDVVSAETQKMIKNALPESYPVPDYNPHYISSGYDTDLVLTENADVWVTFVSEGASYKNVLGFYTYNANANSNANDKDHKKPTAEEITIIFPNVSAYGSGGGLKMGDKVKIGTFKKGTAIGWVLLANGWKDKVTDGLWQLYSNPFYNPEANSVLKHHNVLLKDPKNERIILGFEDVRRDLSNCDNDFNDAIFYVTANPYSAISTENVVDVSEATPISSANNGGLESNGNLASLIAKRNFTREKEGNDGDKRTAQKTYDKKSRRASKVQTTSLEAYLPETGMFGTEVAQISSPTDLIGITNASEIFSIDLYDNENRISAALATATKGSVYDHSKSICDRLNNSSLEDVRNVTVRGHQVISSKIIRSGGEIEHTLSFSIKLGDTENQLYSFWNIDQYPAGDYYNFQIWGSSFSQVFSIANHIIDTLTAEKMLTSVAIEDNIPAVFVKSGIYKNGKIYLEIINKAQVNEIVFSANITETEKSSSKNVTQNVALTGAWTEEVRVDTGSMFDAGLSITSAASNQKDVLYLADGPWGTDYLADLASVASFDITATDAEVDENTYQVERNVAVSGELKGTFNMFRHLLPGDQVLNVSDFNSLKFEMSNSQPVEIIVMTDEISDWNKRLRKTILASNSKVSHTISFEDFVDDEGNSFDLKTIRTIVFSVNGNYSTYVPFSVDITNVQLKESSVAAVEGFNNQNSTTLKNYPNPFSGTTTLVLPTSASNLNIQVYDTMGRLVDQKALSANGTNKANYTAPQQLKGLFHYVLQADGSRLTGTFVIQ